MSKILGESRCLSCQKSAKAQLQGEAKFGPPDDATRAAINAMSDLERLDELAVRLMNAASWQELVPVPRRRNGRRRPGG